MRSKDIFIIFIVSVVCLSLSLTLSAQQGRGKGRLRGHVQDEVGNPIEGAKIVAQHLQYKTTFTSESDKKGNWAVAGLGTGSFSITASKEGYGTVFHEMRVSQFSKKNPPLNFTLRKIQVADMNMPSTLWPYTTLRRYLRTTPMTTPWICRSLSGTMRGLRLSLAGCRRITFPSRK